MSANYVYINNTFFKSEDATILVKDLSVQRGYGIFDFFKTINNKPIFLDDHLDRFYYSAAQMRLQVAQSREELKKTIAELMKLNNMPDSGIRITVTGGYSEDGYNLAPQTNMILNQSTFKGNPEAVNGEFKLVTYDYQRQLSHIKTLDYLTAIWLQPFIKENGADDVLYHNKGVITECPRANFFLVTKDNTVITAKDNVLKGVIRKNILALLQTDIKIEEREVTINDIENAKEAFITSTTKNILPVTAINGKVLGNGTKGTVTLNLYHKLQEKIGQHMY